MTEPTKIDEILRELCHQAYWYGEETGDYECEDIDLSEAKTALLSAILSSEEWPGYMPGRNHIYIQGIIACESTLRKLLEGKQ